MSQAATAPATQEIDPDSCLARAVRLEGTDLLDSLESLPGWSVDNGRLRRLATFESFADAVTFATRLALLAERENHHPSFTVDKRKVEIELWTRKLDAVTTLDLELAQAIERVVGAHP